MSTLLAALDNSPVSGSVARAALAFARVLGADRVEAVHARSDGTTTATAAAERAGLELAIIEGELVDRVDELVGDPDVAGIAVGARGAASGRRPAGHTALGVVEVASKPVLVVPPDYEVPRVGIERALVPVDDAATADAVDPIIRNLCAAGVEVLVAHIFDSRHVPQFWDRPGRDEADWGTEFLARTCRHEGAKITVRRGPAPSEVLDIARADDVDVVVLAWGRDLSPGHAQLVRELLAGASVPVLLVPRREPDRPEEVGP